MKTTRRVERIFRKVAALKPTQGLRVTRLTGKELRQLRSMCHHEEILLKRLSDGAGVTTLITKPRYKTYIPKPKTKKAHDTRKPPTQELEEALRKYCQRRRVTIPRLSEIFEILRQLGYERTSVGDFENWMKTLDEPQEKP